MGILGRKQWRLWEYFSKILNFPQGPTLPSFSTLLWETQLFNHTLLSDRFQGLCSPEAVVYIMAVWVSPTPEPLSDVLMCYCSQASGGPPWRRIIFWTPTKVYAFQLLCGPVTHFDQWNTSKSRRHCFHGEAFKTSSYFALLSFSLFHADWQCSR